MRATCHVSSVQRRYCSGFLSLSHVVVIALSLGAAFLPLLLALGSRDFVLRVSSYSEQPTVELTHQVLSILEGERGDGEPLTLVHTTFPDRTKQLFSNASFRTAVVQSSTVDIHGDGAAESIHVEITTPLSTNETIRQATVMVVLNYSLKVHLPGLQSYAKLSMDVLAVCRHSSALAGNVLFADGDLHLHQRSALEITESMQYLYADSPIVDAINTDTTQELLVPTLISGYRQRNYTATFHAPHPIWTSDTNATAQFRVSMDIRIDPADVIYTPQWPEIVKHAWIQYYCIFVVVSTLAVTLREYLFANKLLASVCVVETPRQKFADKYH